MIIQICGAFVAVFTMSMITSLPKKFLWMAGTIAAISWGIYLVCQYYGLGLGMSIFNATFTTAFISHILARVFKAPVTMFLIPGVLPLVPGVNTYRIAYYLIAKEADTASYYMAATLTIAGMIAIGVFVVDTIFRVYSTLRNQKYVHKNKKI